MDIAAPKGSPKPSRTQRRAEPCAFVIFGAGGDLTRRLLMPALYNLAAARRLPEPFAVIGVARNAVADAEFRHDMKEALRTFATTQLDLAVVDRLVSCFAHVGGDFADPQTYERLKTRLAEVGQRCAVPLNCIFIPGYPASGVHGHRRAARAGRPGSGN